jgi:hypothetical protein
MNQSQLTKREKIAVAVLTALIRERNPLNLKTTHARLAALIAIEYTDALLESLATESKPFSEEEEDHDE